MPIITMPAPCPPLIIAPCPLPPWARQVEGAAALPPHIPPVLIVSWQAPSEKPSLMAQVSRTHERTIRLSVGAG